MKTKQLLDAEKKDAVFQASIEFIGNLTGMKPPPIETAPPETFATFMAFIERVCEIFSALEADIANLGEPYGWQVQGLRDTFKGDHAEMDAKAEAARVGGTAYAFPIYIDPTAVTESTP